MTFALNDPLDQPQVTFQITNMNQQALTEMRYGQRRQFLHNAYTL